ncbi:protein FAM169B-like isoform X2 [Bacillus rossius redtenbacheri]|uniref:protein FAM169B-like isoform X2 n=1 Tax=Bacillus rossius redtenbacheri TaxID=93214 RepID=UPI002FDE9959
MECKRCQITVRIIPKNTTDGLGLEQQLQELACPACGLCVAVKSNEKWLLLEDVLTSSSKHGWLPATSCADKVVHYVLSQILYNMFEIQDVEMQEVFYDLPDPADAVNILWLQGKAIGFYTVKLKDSVNEATSERYAMDTLDTAYIQPSHRRCGHGLAMVQEFVSSRIGKEVGFSAPISSAMRGVLEQFLRDNPAWRESMWEVSGTGGDGNRKLLWLSLSAKRKLQDHNSCNTAGKRSRLEEGRPECSSTSLSP